MRKIFAQKEEGFVLVWALLLMVVVLILGVSGIGTSVFDSIMAANHALHKQAFYQSDGGSEIGAGLVYQNAVCSNTIGGFQTKLGSTSAYQVQDQIIAEKKSFSNTGTLASPVPTLDESNRDAVFYPTGKFTDATLVAAAGGPTANDSLPHTNLRYQSKVAYKPGSGLTMVAGYEGLGASSIGGGSSITYTIESQYNGIRNSHTTVTTNFLLDLSVINSASPSDCIY